MTSAFSSLRGLDDGLGRHHHAEVHDVVVVALEHHGDDVLADVVHVALHRGDHELPLARPRLAALRLFRLDVRHQMRHRLLHDASRLHHLRQEHLPGAEQVADHVHAVHQRTLDHSIGRGNLRRASSVSATMCVVMPLTSACVRRSSTLAGAPGFVLGAVSLAPALTVSANSTSRSVASGRRLNSTSSTRSRAPGRVARRRRAGRR